MSKFKPFIIIGIVLLSLIFIFSIAGGRDKIVINEEGVEVNNPDPIHPCLKVFLENSGSMDGYMVAGSQFKDALYSYISDLEPYCEDVELNFINSEVRRQNLSLKSYIQNLTPASFKLAGGDRSNSDLGDVIETVLEKTESNTVSMFISDCILDLPSKDATKYLENRQIDIKNAILKKRAEDNDFAVIIMRMESLFSGKYFYVNGEVETLTNVIRPYYIWVLGNKYLLSRLKREVPLEMIKNGPKTGEYLSFTNHTNIPFEISNVSMTHKIITEKKGVFEILLRADFSNTLQNGTIISDISNYRVVSPEMKLTEIQPVLKDNAGYTHCLKFELANGKLITGEDVKFQPVHMSKWVEEYNDGTGIDIIQNLNKTTGIKFLIQGVADAYKKDEVSTNFRFTIKKK